VRIQGNVSQVQFPVSFAKSCWWVWCCCPQVAARVLDVLLQSDSDAMLPRMGLAVMEALSSKLLELDDFEELITYLKVSALS
jgi:hypothetical protein